jgi:hypothetical protein
MIDSFPHSSSYIASRDLSMVGLLDSRDGTRRLKIVQPSGHRNKQRQDRKKDRITKLLDDSDQTLDRASFPPTQDRICRCDDTSKTLDRHSLQNLTRAVSIAQDKAIRSMNIDRGRISGAVKGKD